MNQLRGYSHGDYKIGWICALQLELEAATAALDETHRELLRDPNDRNHYTLGRIKQHYVANACPGSDGLVSAATTATDMRRTFGSLEFCLLVGIGGGVPTSCDIRLGDVVVSRPTGASPGVWQYDHGREVGNDRIQVTGSLNNPSRLLLSVSHTLPAHSFPVTDKIQRIVSEMERKHPTLLDTPISRERDDLLFNPTYEHVGPGVGCRECNPAELVKRAPRRYAPLVHYGVIGSGNLLIRNGRERDRLAEGKILCFEMEAAGLTDQFPYLIIRGISDYADSHKNDDWQKYAAVMAAAYAKVLLSETPAVQNHSDGDYDLRASQRFQVRSNVNSIPALKPFVGREEALQKLWALLNPQTAIPRRIVVIHGLGGIGKSQLASHFAEIHAEEYSAIFWLNARTNRQLLSSIAKVADEVLGKRIISEGETARQKADRFLRWLSIEGNTKWLLILDDVTSSHAPSLEGIKRLLPPANHGSIIITTRYDDFGRLGDLYSLKQLDNHESVTLLNRTMRESSLTLATSEEDNHPHEDVTRLAELLAGLPLALVIAGSYIRRTGESVQKYIMRYKRSSWEPFQGSGGSLRTTWAMSYKEVNRQSPAAAELLLLLSHFDNNSIWYELISEIKHSQLRGWLSVVASDPGEWSKAIYILKSFSLIDKSKESQQDVSYSLHPVLQSWCQEKASEDPTRYMAQIALIAVGSAVRRALRNSNWAQLQRLTPHAHQISQLVSSGWVPLLKDQNLYSMCSIGLLYRHLGRLREAEHLLRLTVQNSENMHGPGSTLGLEAANNLGAVYRRLGRLPEAEKMLQDVLELLQRQSDEHTALLFDTMDNLGNVYVSLDKLERAKEMYERALEYRKETLGSSHLSTLRTLNNLGSLYELQGDLKKAEETYRLVLREKSVDEDISILDTVDNLARLCVFQERFEEATSLYHRLSHGRERTFGSNHPVTWDSWSNLVYTYIRRDMPECAVEVFQRLSECRERAVDLNRYSEWAQYDPTSHGNSFISVPALSVNGVPCSERLSSAEYNTSPEIDEPLTPTSIPDLTSTEHLSGMNVNPVSPGMGQARGLHLQATNMGRSISLPGHTEGHPSHARQNASSTQRSAPRSNLSPGITKASSMERSSSAPSHISRSSSPSPSLADADTTHSV